MAIEMLSAIRWRRGFQVVCIVSGIGLLLGLGYLNTVPQPPLSTIQFVMLYGGIGLIVWGLGGGWPGLTALLRSEPALTRNEILALLAILVLAFGLRLWRLEDSIRVLVDELNPINEILHLWDNPRLPILEPIQPYSPFPRVFAAWGAAAASQFGHTLWALRLPSVVVGTLTVGVVYFLGRSLFTGKTALMAALLLATIPLHLHFSRINALHVADPLVGSLAVWFLVGALRSNQHMAWTLSGAALGLTQYFYEGGRLLFPGLVAVWLLLKLLHQPQNWQQWRRGLMIWCVTAVIVAAPVYITLSQFQEPAAARLNQNLPPADYLYALLTARPGSNAFQWLGQHLLNPLLLFISQPDTGVFYGGDQPLILLVLLPAFFAGLFWAGKVSSGRMLLLWFALTWAGNLLLADSALASRYVVVLPAVVLLLALGITSVATHLKVKQRDTLAWGYVVACCLIQVIYYFGPHLDTFNRQIRPDRRDAYDAILRTADLPPGTRIYLVQPPPTMTETYARTFLRYVAPDLEIYFVDDVRGLDWEQLAGPVAFFVPRDAAETIALLNQHFDLQPPQDTPYFVPAETYRLYRPTFH
ncbi:MAG TPA: glycosyltransferase family 39 protein [Phototrophicaceae bacterium]|nr:glycosyltransferase family 39 protein [Phototrophicaceae bacterium]